MMQLLESVLVGYLDTQLRTTILLTARGLTALLSQCVSISLIDVGRISSAYGSSTCLKEFILCIGLKDFKTQIKLQMQEVQNAIMLGYIFPRLTASPAPKSKGNQRGSGSDQ
eukprot:1144578-Pelagomonas_calceolata.AAC.1